MTHAAHRHRELDRQFLEALARDGDAGGAHALVRSRNRLKDLQSMKHQPQARVLLATLTEP